jgi:hypothetical protein
MALFRSRFRVHALRFLPRQTVAFVFEQHRADRQISESEYAPAMNGRSPDSDSTHGVAVHSE